jgi:putative Mn2+ efflux pump MntP
VSVADFISILFIAIGLSADCFAVSLSSAISLKSISRLLVLRIAAAFGLFQGLMPVLGWLAGQTIVDLIADFDHWIAFILLAIIGMKMIWESFRSEKERNNKTDITSWFLLLTLSVATSIDALAVGLSFAFMEVNIVTAVITIGVISFIVTIIGLLLSRRVGKLFGKRAETVGGIILIGIGLRILISHIL